MTSLSDPVSDSAPVPPPLWFVSPATVDGVSLPCEAVRSTLTSSPPASASATLALSVLGVSSSVVIDAGMVIDGASFSPVIVKAIVSVSVRGPPDPLWARSSVRTVTVSTPLKSASGVYRSPSSFALTCATVPVKSTESPVTPFSVICPCSALTVTLTSSVPASTSATDGAPAPDSVLAVSSVVDCAPGTVFTGASLTALTPIETESLSLFAPPEPP
ncbi:MAG: hypothetical protein AVDCRST_MAG85-3412 [uncultured Solirubrobacteraceae bacterium]|uniref:Uncharacterized protein n=1 Tax=uncultured Solirubrobacteraceae bacterium TaxID=1162706 RepID=A0A6J4TN80_9ACTN|nr:MAG: hypothetical protein AVDCRST_MAG85-3412 [uncultured Solirubrobacteraceae bacterium]